MSSDESWVDEFRTEHECDEHWELRRSFLLTHKNRFPIDRLVCLAQVFTNVEFLGCRYPEKTMQLVADLSKEVAADYREKQKTRLQRTFVKASDAAGAKVKGLKRPGETTEQPSAAKEQLSNTQSDSTPTKTMKYSNFVPASSQSSEITSSPSQNKESTETASSVPQKEEESTAQNNSLNSGPADKSSEKAALSPKQESKNQNIYKNVTVSATSWQSPKQEIKNSNASSQRDTSSSKPQIDNNTDLPKSNFSDKTGINSVATRLGFLKSTVSERTFQFAPKAIKFSQYGGVRTYHIDRPKPADVESTESPEIIIEERKKPDVPVIDLEEPSKPPMNKEQIKAAYNAINSSPYGRLVLVEIVDVTESPTQIIHRSTKGCQVPSNYVYENLPGGKVCCKLYVNQRIVAQGIDTKNKSAREIASVEALQRLQEHCFTLKIKAKVLSDGTTVEKDDPSDRNSESDNAIGDDNIGSKLMKLMGWSGGGLGKEEQGIEEPINVSQRLNRSGLGLQPSAGNNMYAFAQKMTRILRDFANQDTEHDLVFSSDFTKPERKKMHEIAQKLNLKTKSYGKDDDRYLVVSHKTSILKIVQRMLQCGGVSEKYELLHPSSMKVT